MTEEKSKTPKTDLLDWRVAYKDTQETKVLIAKDTKRGFAGMDVLISLGLLMIVMILFIYAT